MAAEYTFFTEETAKTFRAAAACIVPTDEGSLGAASEGAVRLADRALGERPERDRKLITTFLKAVEILPVLRYGRRFSNLDRDRQNRVLAFLESTTLVPKLRQGFFGLKTFALLGYYGQDETWGELGYPGPRLDAPYYRLRVTE